MPSRCDMEAAVPKCDRPVGLYAKVRPCAKPLRWHEISGQGKWVCPVHGPVMSGLEAAVRAGYELSARQMEGLEAA